MDWRNSIGGQRLAEIKSKQKIPILTLKASRKTRKKEIRQSSVLL
jgi:hypothetical protein